QSGPAGGRRKPAILAPATGANPAGQSAYSRPPHFSGRGSGRGDCCLRGQGGHGSDRHGHSRADRAGTAAGGQRSGEGHARGQLLSIGSQTAPSPAARQEPESSQGIEPRVELLERKQGLRTVTARSQHSIVCVRARFNFSRLVAKNIIVEIQGPVLQEAN